MTEWNLSDAEELVALLSALYPEADAMSALEVHVEPGAVSARERWQVALERLRREDRLAELSQRVSRDESVSAYDVQLVSSALLRLGLSDAAHLVPVTATLGAIPEAFGGSGPTPATERPAKGLSWPVLAPVLFILALLAYVAFRALS